jgi:long-chain acyl-CoA synthetase
VHPQYLSSGYGAPDDHIKTLYDCIETTISRHPEAPYLGERQVNSQGEPGPYHWTTYKRFGELRTELGSGLLHYGLAPHQTVGIYSVNCTGWVLTAEACNAYSMVTVPLYDTLGPDAVRYISGHAELAAIACSANLLSVLLPCLAECPTIQLVIVYNGSPSDAGVSPPRGTKARIVTLEEVQAAGRRHLRSHVPPAPSDVSCICYTSGTTGVPKGAVLTHANFIANSAGMAAFVPVGPGDRHISYLPLAHIYERVTMVTATHFGCAVGFYRGDVLLLLEDIEELQPTLFTSVPRLYNRIYDKVMGAIAQSSPVARKLFHLAYESKRAALKQGDLSGGRFGPLWDRLVFSKVRARLGGQVRLMTTGASPISAEVFDFLRICFGATVIEGYGMTETCCVISMTSHGDAMGGHVGGPVVCCEIKLVDIPEMNYTHTDKPYPRGEICVRGPSIFQGYYKAGEQTREVLDEDGWLHTGDVGTWLEGGRLKIIDRKKNIFKLAQGEYVAPEKIENVYVRSPFVAQSFVFGDSLRHQLVAVVVPDPDHLLPWAASRGLPRELQTLCKNKAVKAAVLASMRAEGKAAKLNSFEQVAAVHLTPDLFSVENGLMTPTFKLKRPQASAAFKAAIAALYEQLDGAAK